jgi:ketosteroid isomerase-like protein
VSRENVDRILAGYDALSRGDLDGVVAGFSPDFELRAPPILPDTEIYRGPEGFRRFWQAWIDNFDDLRIEVEEVIDAEDRIVVMAAVCGRGKDSGAEVRSPSFPHVWTLQGDEITGMEALPNRAAAIEALGLERND